MSYNGMRIYGVGKFEEQERMRIVMRVLLKHDYIITFDWTDEENVVDYHPVRNAIQDLRGVATADALIVLLEKEYNYKGLWVEVGAALISGTPVYRIGTFGDTCLFTHHPLFLDFVKDFPATDVVVEIMKELGANEHGT